MATAGIVLITLIRLYLLILTARVIINLVTFVDKEWVPSGFLRTVVHYIYVIAEPPLALVRRFIPKMSFGGISVALEIFVVYFGLQFLIGIIRIFFR